MKKALFQFTSVSLASASRGFLDKLGIKYQKSSDKPIPKDAILNKLNPSPTTREAFDIVTGIYFIGLIDDRTFNNISDSIDYDSAVRVAGGDKYKGMLCFACELSNEAKVKRTTYAILTRAFNKLANNKPVVLITRQGDKLGLSTCERIDKKRDVGEKMGKVNLLQNINCTEPHTGHIRILESLQVGAQINTFDALYKHWFDAFNTKTLTDSFYKELYNWYMWVVNDPNTHFPENSHLPDHENEKKNVKIIRLITRLLFVWFIKEKKVKRGEGLPDIGLVPDNLFDTGELDKILNDFDPYSATEGDYYNAILQNLFFATLNNEVKSRKFIDTSNFYRSKKGYTVKNLYRDNKDEDKSWFKISHDEVLDLFKTVPFLNCGLFECLDKYKRTDISYDVDRFFDGYSTKSGDKFRACLPNRLFFARELPEITIEVTENGKKVPLKIKSKGLINILNEYVFTVEENTPLEQQVSLDPELLGKVFENLLAAYNPETEESARKSSGSYYTPREIVEYMVNESLIQYLKTKLNADDETETQLRNLVSPSNLDFNFSDNQQDTILEALYHCRILDPACGSGAFPMGMLQQMVHIISRLDEHNKKWEKLITQKATDETTKAFENKELTDEERKTVIADITNTFTNNKNNPDYTRKLYLIQNCIFGVDIQPIAMMISKLRFFISLICEQDEKAINFNDEDNNFGIHTLPNLETKFVAANSLLTPDVRKFTGDWTNDKQLDKLKDELMELRYRHVTARSMKDKMNIRTLDDEKRQEINEYILSTQAHADPAKIAMCQDQIAHLMLERKLYEGENIVEEYVDTQADLFAETTRELVRKDVNRTKRDEIDRQIHICQAQIEREKAKENITGFAAAVKQLTEWNPYDQVKSSPFFDPDWMFGITDGFNIVMGNPPYIDYRDIDKSTIMGTRHYSLYDKSEKPNLFLFFVEESISLLKNEGTLTFINPLSMLVTDASYGLRKYILGNGTITWIENVSNLKVFREASTYVAMWSFSKNTLTDYVIRINNCVNFDDFGKTSFILDIELVNRDEKLKIPINSNSLLINKIENNKRKLSQIATSNWGTSQSGYGKLKITSLEYNRLDDKQKSKYDKIVQTADIKRYTIEWQQEYIPKSIYSQPIQNKFKLDKILIARVTKRIQATIDNKKHYYVGKATLLTEVKENQLYLLALLNSNLISFWYFSKFEATHMNGGYLRYDIPYLEQMPVPQTLHYQPIITLVERILSAKESEVNADTTTMERKLDVLVYLLYGLTWDDVQVVEKSFCQMKEEGEGQKNDGKNRMQSNFLPKLNMDENTYNRWLEQFVHNNTFPNDEELIV